MSQEAIELLKKALDMDLRASITWPLIRKALTALESGEQSQATKREKAIRKVRAIMVGFGVSMKATLDALAYCRNGKLPNIEDIPLMPPVKPPLESEPVKCNNCCSEFVPICRGEGNKCYRCKKHISGKNNCPYYRPDNQKSEPIRDSDLEYTEFKKTEAADMESEPKKDGRQDCADCPYPDRTCSKCINQDQTLSKKTEPAEPSE